MGNTTSFTNVTQVVGTDGGLLLDTSSFANMSTHGPLSLTFDTVWVADAGGAPLGPYEATSSAVFENLSGTWRGPEKADNTWWLTWSPAVGEDVKYTHVRWIDMSEGDLVEFQHGFSASLKKRLDSPGAVPLSEDRILGEALEGIQATLGYDVR